MRPKTLAEVARLALTGDSFDRGLAKAGFRARNLFVSENALSRV